MPLRKGLECDTTYICMDMYVHIVLQGSENASDALSLQVIFCKRALWLMALLWKETCNLRHPLHLRQPVCSDIVLLIS